MKRILSVLTMVFVTNSFFAQSYQWLNQFDGDIYFEHNMVTDRNGYLYFAGGFHGMITLDGADFYSNGESDALLIKFNASGNIEWVFTAGSDGYDAFTGIEIDKGNGIAVSGTFTGTVVFGTEVIESLGLSDAILAGFNSSGNVRYLQTLGSNSFDSYVDIAIDKEGNKYVCGDRGANLSFNDVDYPLGPGMKEAMIAKYDVMGNPLWIEFFPSSWHTGCDEIEIDKNNNIVVGGNLLSDISIDGNFYTTELEAVFITKLDPLASEIWTQIMPVAYMLTYNTDLILDKTGNVYASYSLGELTLDGNTFTNTTAGINSEALILKLNKNNGSMVWANKLNSFGASYCYDLAINNNNQLVAAGNYISYLNYGFLELEEPGQEDLESFILTVELDGTAISLTDFENGEDNDRIEQIAFDRYGNMFIYGSVYGELQIGDFMATGYSGGFLTMFGNAPVRESETELPVFDLLIYPNPAVDIITINTNVENTENFVITNQIGEQVLSGTLENNKTIDVSMLSSGMYFINISTTNETQLNSKFTKL